MKEFLTLKSVDEILEMITDIKSLEFENIPLMKSRGRVLASAIKSSSNLPGFDRSTVDGFAVHASDLFGASESSPSLLDIQADCIMGEEPDFLLERGKCARILTGGMLPKGADAVVMIEYFRGVGKNQAEFIKALAPGDNVLFKDEDLSAGDEVFYSGLRIMAHDIGLLAALGTAEVPVVKMPKVAVISTGDEIVEFHNDPPAGKIRESNGPALFAYVEELGCVATYYGIVLDDESALTKTIEQALSGHDIVLISGGSSAGERDFALPAIKKQDGFSLLFHGVAMRPGKPTLMARNGNKFICGLPGNPTAALLVAEVLVRPIIESLLGLKENISKYCSVDAKISRRVSSAQGRRDYIRITLHEDDDKQLIATPLVGASGLVSNLVMADGVIICPESQEGLEAGSIVEVKLLRSLSSKF